MVLSSMIITDEDALICDFAETYQIYNYRSLPINLVATLACGLKQDSRIMMKMNGLNADVQTILLAMSVDSLRVLVWQNTQDGQKGRNQPKSITKAIMGIEDKTNIETYASGDDFEAAWKEITGG